MAKGSQVVVGGRTVKVSNLDKVMYPATGLTKGEVIAYYQAVAPWFVHHAAGRPATRKRWPNGVGTPEHPQKPFFHKNLDAKSTPDWVRTFTIEHSDGPSTYPLIDDAATLVWLAQLASLELHVPQWRVGPDSHPLNPDRLVLDLDPGAGAGMPECVELAHRIREVLDGVGFASYPVTSGSKGIHLYAALDGSMTSDDASNWARDLARSLESLHPGLLVSDMKKAAREGKVLLDWSQNNAAKTTVAPYSLRGRERPTVAAPRTWDEITPDLRQLEFHEVIERLHHLGDPLEGLAREGDDRPASADRLTERPDDGLGGVPRIHALSHTRLGADEKRVSRLKASEPGSPADLPVIEPMLATLGSPADVTGTGWRFEVKWDGYRAVATVGGGRATFRSRGGIDLTATYPELAELAGLLAAHRAVLDGEIVVLDDNGRPRFELLQGQARSPRTAHYMVFDLMHLDGVSLLRRPYLERREKLRDLLGAGGTNIHVPDDLGTEASTALSASAEQQLEGVVAKREDSVYQPGQRAHTWVKIKHTLTQDVVVIGWAPGENARARTIGSLLVAVPARDGMVYVGRVGSGFTEQALHDALEVLREIETDEPSVPEVPAAEARGVHWVEPLLVGEVKYSEFTGGGRLRHPVWKGWRPDRTPDDVRWEGRQGEPHP